MGLLCVCGLNSCMPWSALRVPRILFSLFCVLFVVVLSFITNAFACNSVVCISVVERYTIHNG